MIDWGNASVEDILQKYAELTGGAVTPAGGGGQFFQKIKDWGANFVQRNGRQPTREEWAQIAAIEGGITPEQALSIYDQGKQYFDLTGQWPDENMFNQLLNQTVPGYGQTPTLPREALDEDKRQFDIGQGNWGKQFDEAQRQYNVNSSGWLDGAGSGPTLDREKVYADLFSRLSGPQDWVKYQMAQSGIPAGSLGQGGLAEVFNRTPAFGGTTPDPSNSWENKIAQLWDQTRQQPPAETTPAAPPAATPPSVEMPAQAPGVPVPPPAQAAPAAPPPAAQPPAPAAPKASFQDFANYIASFKAQNNRDLTEQEWISWVGTNMGLSPAQAKWVRDQGIRSFNAGKGWPGEDVFGQLVDYARTAIPTNPNPVGAGPSGTPTPTPTYSTQPVGAPIPGPTGTVAPGPQGAGKGRTASAQAGQNGVYPWQQGQPGAAPPAPGATDMWGRSRQAAAPNVGPKPAVQPGMQPGIGGGTTTGQQPPSYLDLAEQLGRRLPTEINARDYYRMTPSQRAMQSSAWSAAALDPEDMWQKTRAALPKGQANTRIRWG